MVSRKKVFLDAIIKQNDALCMLQNFSSTCRQEGKQFCKESSLVTDVHKGEILRSQMQKTWCLKSASFWQTMYRAETHFSLVCISGCFETRTYNPSGYLTSATCIALLDRAPCQAIKEFWILCISWMTDSETVVVKTIPYSNIGLTHCL